MVDIEFSAKDYTELLVKQLRTELAIQRAGDIEALHLAREELKRRLENLNGEAGRISETIAADRMDFMRQAVYEAKHAEVLRRVDENTKSVGRIDQVLAKIKGESRWPDVAMVAGISGLVAFVIQWVAKVHFGG